MSHARTIQKAILQVRNRLLLNRVMLCALYVGVMGMVPGLIVLLLSLWFPIYYAVPLALGACLLGLLAGACYGAATRPPLRQAALAADRAGLGEALITALEFQESNRIFHRLQREQTVERLSGFDLKAAFPITVPVRECLVFALTACLCAVLAMIPAAARDAALERHVIRQMIDEETAKIERVLETAAQDAAISGLPDEQWAELSQLLDSALEEMETAQSAEELEREKDRLSKKLEIAASEAESERLASVTLKIADELGLSVQTEQTSTATSGVEESLRELMEGGGSALSEAEWSELAKELAQLLEEGDLSQMDLSEAAEMLNMDEEALREALQSIAEEVALGEAGEGSGDPAGEVGGALLVGGRTGQGYDTGEKTGFERESAAPRQEELEIPGRVPGDDDNLTGTETQGQSFFTETENGPTWTGRRVDYNEVVGDYAAEAHNRINHSEIPGDMKEIVRDYFSGLTSQER